MTVSTTTNRITYTGDGVTTVFAFPYKFIATADLVIYVAGVLLTTGYTVGAPTDTGANVIFTAAPANAAAIIILANPAQLQSTSLPSTGPFPAKAVETALDKLTLLIQRVSELATRSFRLSDSDTSGASTVLPTPTSNALIGWNQGATALQNVNPTTLATIVAFGTANADVFTGTGAQTVFTLSANPGAQANLDVAMGGVTQLPFTDYAWGGGTTVTFATAPPNGVKLLIRYFQGLPQGVTDSAASTFIQSGAGSVTRTAQEKMRETSVSIADKGGTTASLDNSAALLAAVTDSRSVYIPDGVWKVTTSVALLDGSYIWGPGTIYRTTAGPIFTATGKLDLTIKDIGLKGNQNSWALQFKDSEKIRVLHSRCQDIMLIETDSATSAYGTTVAANMCRDVIVYGNVGQCDIVPNAVSQQFIRMLYTYDFSVCMNSARGYRDLVLAWGGDYTTSGAAANERKCYNGLIEGNRGTVLAAGIWTGMASDIRIVGNKLAGGNLAEGLDAEGSTNITFDSNDAFGFADGITVFGLNRNIRFLNNNIDATANVFRNASSTFYADYGLLEFIGNSFKSATAACVPWVTSSVERMRLINNRFENVEITLTDAAVAEVIFTDNELYYDYAPAAIWCVRFGSLLNGYTKQPKKSQMIIKKNTVEWRGAGISTKRAFGLSSSTIANFYDIQQNNFVGFDEQISYEGSTGAMTVLAKRNTFDAAATYPSVLHGSSAGMTVIWQDNDRSDGLDAYGTNTPASSFFSDASRIWTNTPTNGATPGWVRRTGAWGPMANIG